MGGGMIWMLVLLHWFCSQIYDVNGSSVQTMLETVEMQALVNLKQSLQVQEGVWPMNSDPCSNWSGIDCDGGHVVSILLSGLPHAAIGDHQTLAVDALQSLPFLRSLNASGFALSGGVPVWFNQLAELRHLDLTAASLQGAIPPPLGLLTKLKTLSLAKNNLSGPISPALDKLLNLEHLDLSSNHFTGSFPLSLSNAAGLMSIDLSSNRLTGMFPSADIGKLVSLRHLALAGNLFQGTLALPWLRLSNLNHLDLSNNQLSGNLPPGISYLKNLSSLNLANNNLNGLIPPDISNCTGLQVLILSRNLLTGELPLSLISLKRLVDLSLSVNSLTGSLPPSLVSLPNLRSLELSHNFFYGPLPLNQGQMGALATLDVSYNFLNGSIPRGFLPSAATRRNCFRDAPKQHSVRACRLFYRKKGLSLDNLLPQSILPPGNRIPRQVTADQGYRSKHLIAILVGATGGALFVICAGAFALCFNKYEREVHLGAKEKAGDSETGRTSSSGAGVCSMNFSSLGEAFSLEVLNRATRSFSPSCVIATGRTGDFYKGILDGGAAVVVKRIQSSKVMKELYLHELEVCGKASHTRLVSLLGYCLDVTDEKFLVYKYMPNGDLASALHRKGVPSLNNEELQPSLDWITRLKIAISVAEGLTYLHHECSPPIVHRNIKASGILLDDKFEVRLGSLSDACVEDGESHPGLLARLLGLSQSSDQVDPGSSIASCAKDVYSFGKVLLELISGKVGISDQSDPRTDSWVEWALSLINIHDRESLSQLMDPFLIVDEDLLQEVWAVAIIAKACLNPKPSRRPSVRHVLKALENPHKVIQEENLEAMVSRTSSHSSWNEALFGACRAASASQSLLMSETSREESAGIFHRAGNSTSVVMQNASYNTGTGRGSGGDFQEVVYKT